MTVNLWDNFFPGPFFAVFISEMHSRGPQESAQQFWSKSYDAIFGRILGKNDSYPVRLSFSLGRFSPFLFQKCVLEVHRSLPSNFKANRTTQMLSGYWAKIKRLVNSDRHTTPRWVAGRERWSLQVKYFFKIDSRMRIFGHRLGGSLLCPLASKSTRETICWYCNYQAKGPYLHVRGRRLYTEISIPHRAE